MAKTLTPKNAITLLKKAGYNYIKSNGKHFLSNFRIPNSDDEVTEREIVKRARNMHPFGSKTAIKKDDRLNRKKERQAIKEGKADELPQNKPLYKADPWDHD